jgi:hypothetical protein
MNSGPLLSTKSRYAADKFQRGIYAAAGLVPEPHYGESRLGIGREIFRFVLCFVWLLARNEQRPIAFDQVEVRRNVGQFASGAGVKDHSTWTAALL